MSIITDKKTITHNRIIVRVHQYIQVHPMIVVGYSQTSPVLSVRIDRCPAQYSIGNSWTG